MPNSSLDIESIDEDKDTIYFHIVAHSHDDVGWTNTPDEYYEQRVN